MNKVRPKQTVAVRLVAILRRILPRAVRPWLRRQQGRVIRHAPFGQIEFGSLRRLQPYSRIFGADRGQSITRYYIAKFLAAHALDIRGIVLEVGEARYTREFGVGRVTHSDVLHVEAGNPDATLVADLTAAEHLPDAQFDCIICTQTLQFIEDVQAAIRTLHRLLKPGGVLLVSAHGISPISRYDMDRWGEYWRFTTRSAERLFTAVFPAATLTVTAYGNVLSATAVLYGLAAEELRPIELDTHDQDFEVLITVRAVKSL